MYIFTPPLLWKRGDNGCFQLIGQYELSCWDPHLIAEIPVWLLRSPSYPRSNPYCSSDPPWLPSKIPTLHYHSPKLQLTPKTSNTISLPSKIPKQPQISPTTCQPSLFYFSPLALHSHFHIPVSVFIFLFLIYCTISVLWLSCSSLCSTIIHWD